MKEQKINSLMNVLREFKALNPKMNMDMALTFLEVAKNRGVTGRDIEVALDTNSTTAARMLRLFDRIQANGAEGLDMVEARIDPTEYRSKLRFLTPKGVEFLDTIDKAL